MNESGRSLKAGTHDKILYYKTSFMKQVLWYKSYRVYSLNTVYYKIF